MRKREKEKVKNLPKKTNITTPRKQIKTKKRKNTPENRLSDLGKTLDINIQILKTFFNSPIPQIKNKSKSNKINNNKSEISKEQLILKAIDNINKKYLQKKELFNKLR